MLLFLPFILLLTCFNVDAAAKKPKNQPPPQKSKKKPTPQKSHKPPQMIGLDPLKPCMTQLVQEDFLVTPEDFSKDPDVIYVMNQLLRHQTVEKFYRIAQTIYDDLGKYYKEIDSDPKLAAKFHDIMNSLSIASLSQPLTVTNIILALTRHLRPLFKTESGPINDMTILIRKLEKDPKETMLKHMTRFFSVYTIREMDQVQNFIILANFAGVDSTTAEAVKAEAKLSAKKSNKSKVSKSSKTSKSSKSHRNSNNNNVENYFENDLRPSSERIRITLANAFTKMFILLDLFVNDPSMANRSVRLFLKLWMLHSSRLAVREKVPMDELDPLWLTPYLYRKFPVNFLYDDWKPGILSKEALAELIHAAKEEAHDDLKALSEQKSRKLYSKLTWYSITFFISASIFALLALALLKYRSYKNATKDEVLVLGNYDSPIPSIVTNLEREADGGASLSII